MSYERPADCEFDKQTVINALKRSGFRCETCGVPKKQARDGYLEIHHKLGIAIALTYYPEISHSVIRSLANAQVLCKDCHQKADNEMRFRHPEMAGGLIGLIQMELA